MVARYFMTCRSSSIRLNRSFSVNTIIPGSESVPSIVYVFPVPAMKRTANDIAMWVHTETFQHKHIVEPLLMKPPN